MDLILNILVIFSLTTTAFTQVPSSGCDLITNENKCFNYFSHSGINWTDARANCQTWGGDLASIANAGENAAVDSIRTSSESGFCWIGLNDIETEGTFVWSDGSNSSYRNWRSTQPDNTFGIEDCVNLNPITWNDLPCNNILPCYYCSLLNANLFGRIEDASTFEELNNNTILSQDTTLYCVTENRNTPLVTWSYVNLDGIRSFPIGATNDTTGVSLLEVTNDNPGIYSCQVTRNGDNVTYIAEFLSPSLNVPSSGCDLITNENKCFSYFSHSGINWFDARANCQTWGGDLASIANAGENAAVDSIRTSSESGFCWIGLNDIETEGTFVWNDGSNSSYRNWNSTQPDNTFGNEHCINLNPITWNDLYCSDNLPCYYCSLLNVNAFGKIDNNVLYTELPNNYILSQNTTLYCISENSTPWSYVDLAGNRTALNSTVINNAIGITTLSVTTNNPGYYSCEVIQSGRLDETYTVGIFDNPSYTFFIPGGVTENRIYTIGIDREEVFLFCNSSNSSISLTDIKWRVTGNDRIFPNPLIPHSNMLLQSGTSYNIQCVDIRTNSTILSTQYTVQGSPVITLNNGSIQSFALLPPNINSAFVTVRTQNVVLSTNLAGRWQRPDNSSVASNTLTFSTFYVTQGGVYKFYVDNWDGQQTLAIQINIALEGLFDQTITSIRTETSSPTSILVSWILLYNQTANSNETFSVYYSTAGGAEVLAGTTSSLFYNITGLLPNVEYPIRIEVNLEYSLIQTFSLQTFHQIAIPNCPSPLTTEVTSTPSTLTLITNTSLNPMTTETISTSTELPISSNFQFTPEIAYTVVVVSMVHILIFTLLIIILSVVFCYYRQSKQRDDDNQKNVHTLQAHVNQANADLMLYGANEHVNKPESNSFETNPIYMELEAAPKESLVETQVSYLGIGDVFSKENTVK